MLPAQTPLCHGYRVKRRNHDERPIEPGDEAHGGLERWKQVRNMQAKVTLNSTLWRIIGRPDGLSGGETWRQLSVIFPPGIPTHSVRQTFYFNDKGLLQRLDYATGVAAPHPF